MQSRVGAVDRQAKFWKKKKFCKFTLQADSCFKEQRQKKKREALCEQKWIHNFFFSDLENNCRLVEHWQQIQTFLYIEKKLDVRAKNFVSRGGYISVVFCNLENNNYCEQKWMHFASVQKSEICNSKNFQAVWVSTTILRGGKDFAKFTLGNVNQERGTWKSFFQERPSENSEDEQKGAEKCSTT